MAIYPVESAYGQDIFEEELELKEDALDISSVSVGTYVRNSQDAGMTKGTHLYVDAEASEGHSPFRMPLSVDVELPDGSEVRIAETFRDEDLTRVWSSEELSGDMPDNPEETDRSKVPEPGTYTFYAEVRIQDQDVVLNGRSTFELTGEMAEDFLDPIPEESVNYTMTDNGMEVKWSDIEGARSYYVYGLLEGRTQSFETVVSENKYLFEEAESEGLERIVVTAFSAPQNENFDGGYDEPPVNLQEQESLHMSAIQLRY